MIPLALILKFAPYAAAGAAAVALATFTPVIGFNARLHHVEASRDQWKDAERHARNLAMGWQASFTKAEALRASETQQSRQAIEADAAQCSARVAEARKSAEAIKRISNAPVKLDASNCPVRVVVGTDSLRDALQPAASR